MLPGFCPALAWFAQSVTFDPFMYLSVPIPVRNEKMVTVVMLPRIRTRYLVRSSGLNGEDGAVAGGKMSVLTGTWESRLWLSAHNAFFPRVQHGKMKHLSWWPLVLRPCLPFPGEGTHHKCDPHVIS